MSLFKSDVEFTTELSINACQARLEAQGITVWQIKSLFTRRETDELGFLWYENPSLWSTLLQGPALLGSIKPEGAYCRIQADYKPYLAWKWVLGTAIIGFLIVILYPSFSLNQIHIVQYFLFAVIITGALFIFGVIHFFMRQPWKRLVTRLAQVIEAVELTRV